MRRWSSPPGRGPSVRRGASRSTAPRGTTWHPAPSPVSSASSYTERTFPLNDLPSGQDDAVRGAFAAAGLPGDDEFAHDLRGHEPEPLARLRNLARLECSQRPAPEEHRTGIGRVVWCPVDPTD